jgi:hypothetical protein
LIFNCRHLGEIIMATYCTCSNQIYSLMRKYTTTIYFFLQLKRHSDVLSYHNPILIDLCVYMYNMFNFIICYFMYVSIR